MAGDLGTTLRQARERRGLTLRQVADRTKIPLSALEALERNDLSRLPPPIFSRAFVRTYAREVGVDAASALDAYVGSLSADAMARPDPAAQWEDNQAIESERRAAETFLWIALISIPLAALILYFGAPST